MAIPALIVVLALAVFAVQLVLLQRSLVSLADDARALASSGVQAASPDRLPVVSSLRHNVAGAEHHLRTLRASTRWFAEPLSHQDWWPWLARACVLVDQGLSAALDLAEVAWWAMLSIESDLALDGQVNTASGVPTVLQSDPIRSALSALGKSRPQLLRARESLLQVNLALSAVQPLLNREPRIESLMQASPLALDALLALPALAAREQGAHILVVIQNNDELRPTGGFVSSVALVKLKGHRLMAVVYSNSYDVEAYRTIHPPAPSPLREHMQASVLLFRDANWSPDFPTSAQVLGSLYQTDVGERVDVVVAVDVSFAEMLLEALGSLDIPDYGITLTADTLMDSVVGFWERPLDSASIDQRDVAHQEWLAHRKDFGGALIKAGLARAQSLTTSELLGLALGVKEAVAAKHLMVWALEDRTLQTDLRRMAWDGRIIQTRDDYLMIVDANVGWNKADRNIERHFDYQLFLDDPEPRAQLTVTYQNRSTPQSSECVHQARYEDSYAALANQCYWNYVRVLTPGGSTLLQMQGADGDVDLDDVSGKASFGTLVVVPPGETRAVQFEYRLPRGYADAVRRGRQYGLYVQKMPGTRVTLGRLRLVLPPGAELVSGSGIWDYPAPGHAETQISSTGDIRIRASWKSLDP